MRLIKKGNRVTKGSKVRNRGGDDNDNKEVGKRQTESGGDRGMVGGSPGLPLVVAGGEGGGSKHSGTSADASINAPDGETTIFRSSSY